MMDPPKVHGLGLFAIAGATYAYFPYMVAIMGSTLTKTGLTAACLGGMYNFNDKGTVNSIEMIKEGENSGMVKFSISTSPFTSETMIASVQNVQAVFTLSNDDLGEDDVEANVISISNATNANGVEIGNK